MATDTDLIEFARGALKLAEEARLLNSGIMVTREQVTVMMLTAESLIDMAGGESQYPDLTYEEGVKVALEWVMDGVKDPLLVDSR